jgi:hypothetical protein
MACDLQAEQTFLGSCYESCDDSGKARWKRLQRVIDHLTAPTPVADSEVQRADFHAWLKKEWPQLTVDFAPLNGFYKGDDGEQIGYMWDGWKARAVAKPVSVIDPTQPCSPMLTQCPRCKNPNGSVCDGGKPVSVDAGGMTERPKYSEPRRLNSRGYCVGCRCYGEELDPCAWAHAQSAKQTPPTESTGETHA